MAFKAFYNVTESFGKNIHNIELNIPFQITLTIPMVTYVMHFSSYLTLFPMSWPILILYLHLECHLSKLLPSYKDSLHSKKPYFNISSPGKKIPGFCPASRASLFPLSNQCSDPIPPTALATFNPVLKIVA
jgi:hypothetical protein